MNELQAQINEDLKQAMRERNEFTLSVLRMLSSSIKNKIISMRSGEEVVLTDEQIQEIISSEVKKRQDSSDAYLAGGRKDLSDKEIAENEILKKYLPAQLSDEEVEKTVKEIIEQSVTKDFGSIMGQAMTRLKGRASGKLVGEMVKKLLS